MNSTSNVAEAELQRKNVEKMVLACVPQAGISEIHDILAWLDVYGMRLVKQSDGMAQGAAHTCSYGCDRPECIKAQRDELAAAAAQEAAGVDAYDDALDQLWKLAGGNDHPVYKRFLDFRDSFAVAPGIDLATAWAEGYRSGVTDERISESNIGIAGFGAKIEPARANPYMIDARPKGGSEAWREGWALAYSGPSRLYGDDGELQDNSEYPYIDWRRDSAEVIRDKITERANRKLAKTQAGDTKVQP